MITIFRNILMKSNKKNCSFFILIILQFITFQSLKSQVDTLNIYQKDFIYLCQLLEDSHPNIYENFPKDKFEIKKKKLLKEFANTKNKAEYSIKLQKFVSNIKDAHTKIQFTLLNSFLYPIRIRSIKDTLFISNIDKSLPSNWLGAKIINFNNIPKDTVINKAKKYFSCDNNICYMNNIVYYLYNYKFLKQLGIIDTSSELKLSITTLKNKNEEITIPHIEKYKLRKIKKVKNLTGYTNRLFHYKILKDKSICYFHYQECYDLQFLKFDKKNYKPLYHLFYVAWWLRGGNFSNFLKKMFKEIEKKNIDNLIVDLRDNSGGSSILNEQFIEYITSSEKIKDYSEGLKLSNLLKKTHPAYFDKVVSRYKKIYHCDSIKFPIYLSVESPVLIDTFSDSNYLRDINSPFYMKEPKKKFKGHIYILTGSNTFSSAAMLAIKLRDNNLVTIVGTPMGQKPTQFGQFLNFRLPLTGVRGHVSSKKLYLPDRSKNNETTLYPDIEIWNTINNEINGRDIVFEKLLEMIK